MRVQAWEDRAKRFTKEYMIVKVAKGDCPIEDCGHSFECKDGLRGHLYNEHRKNDIIEALLTLLGL